MLGHRAGLLRTVSSHTLFRRASTLCQAFYNIVSVGSRACFGFAKESMHSLMGLSKNIVSKAASYVAGTVLRAGALLHTLFAFIGVVPPSKPLSQLFIFTFSVIREYPLVIQYYLCLVEN